MFSLASELFSYMNARKKWWLLPILIVLLVFGGSQGARVMADIVPLAIERLEPRLQMRLQVAQQAFCLGIPQRKSGGT